MTAPQTVAAVLDAAATRLEQPGTWTQYTTARDENGAIVEYDDPRAVRFCALGAIFKAAPLSSPGSIGVDDFFGRYLGGYDWIEIGRFNDAPGRTQSEVVAALRAAATSARQGETK